MEKSTEKLIRFVIKLAIAGFIIYAIFQIGMILMVAMNFASK